VFVTGQKSKLLDCFSLFVQETSRTRSISVLLRRVNDLGFGGVLLHNLLLQFVQVNDGRVLLGLENLGALTLVLLGDVCFESHKTKNKTDIT
jgi:hypothetical protein